METKHAPLLAVGDFGSEQKQLLSEAAQEAAYDLHIERSEKKAVEWLDREHPCALLIDAEASDAQALVLNVRGDHMQAQLPILALVSKPGDLSFAETFSWGGDDVVGLGQTRPLVTRLRALPHERPAPPQRGTERALVADPDRIRRLVLGRVLRNASYQVSFAGELKDVLERATAEHPDLVVLSAGVEDDVRGVVESARQHQVTATWIVTTPPRQLPAQRRSLEGLEGVVATDGFAPAENVLFLANETKNAGVADNRASKRLLFGTTVWLRGVGREEDDCGFTYNVSEGGLYVRTLAPPDDQLVWLELTPPSVERRVRLVGSVAWRRRFGPRDGATVPPGLGVQIVDGAAMDLELWKEGYKTFAAVVS
jgi:DNA-binding response OmpR family regulator